MPMPILRITFLLYFLFSTAIPAAAQDNDEKKLAELIKASYTKYEYEVPVRDGKKLFTAVYVPKDESRPYAILLKRTPYSIRPYGVDRRSNRQTRGGDDSNMAFPLDPPVMIVAGARTPWAKSCG